MRCLDSARFEGILSCSPAAVPRLRGLESSWLRRAVPYAQRLRISRAWGDTPVPTEAGASEETARVETIGAETYAVPVLQVLPSGTPGDEHGAMTTESGWLVPRAAGARALSAAWSLSSASVAAATVA